MDAGHPLAVVAGGHRTDGPDRPEPRFPDEAAAWVGRALAEVLERWELGPGDVLITGGARGADILAAEAALERGAAVSLLLAYPVEEFLDRSVRFEPGRPDDWERRFRALAERSTVLVLDDAVGQDAETRFERNNRWCVDTAAEAAPGGVRGLLVWDRRSESDLRGGTGDLAAELARIGAEVEVLDPSGWRP